MTGLHVERTPDGRRFVVDRVVQAEAGAVWAVLTDTDRWPEWGPSVSAVRATERYIEPGATGEVQVFGGPWVPYEIVTCREFRWTWRVARVPATGHRVERVDDGTRVCFEIPLAALGYAPVCRRALRRIERLSTEGNDGTAGAN
jgi:hypothetical protein